MSSIEVPTLDTEVTQAWGEAVADHLNHAVGKAASSASITTSQTQVVGLAIPANTLEAGDVFRITAFGTCTSTVANAVTFRLRIGTTTLTGNILSTNNPTATTTASNDPFEIDALVTIRTTGASGTATGGQVMNGGATQPFGSATRTDQPTSTQTVDTTVANVLELTAVTAAGTTTVIFRQAVIQKLKA